MGGIGIRREFAEYHTWFYQPDLANFESGGFRVRNSTDSLDSEKNMDPT
jgi:hypothetical protein